MIVFNPEVIIQGPRGLLYQGKAPIDTAMRRDEWTSQQIGSTWLVDDVERVVKGIESFASLYISPTHYIGVLLD